ncbi:MAG: exodeoxyribonuclease VII large subunit [Kiritimatiellae bacterium]|nr:exodeoxyribonuclease VII large subunit [Kiritimatiellia bacterium]MDD5519976.1 exodeoxyribonuclease VII large subunit [Kiritimatiellia bacterium]
MTEHNQQSKNDKGRKVFSVSELTRLIKTVLEETFGAVWVEGEVSNLRRPSSGHYYFTIKDASAQISAVLFRGNQMGLKFQPKDGTLVRVFGQISVYEKSGNYQIIVRQMEEGGKGSLQAQFEALKERLQKEGLFDASRKKQIPMLPQHVGIVTSPTGAAIRDILNILKRRFPNLHLLLAPVKVQGEGAAEEIATAIDLLNEMGGLDVLIVGRGGGSLEDLWAFNEEIVARAIARSRLPVISAVGHEIDFTISDFVADLRAPTPSAAAELVVGRKDAFEDMLKEMSRRLVKSLEGSVLRLKNRLVAAGSSYVFKEPANMARHYRQKIDGLMVRVEHEIHGRLRETQQMLDDYSLRMVHEVKIRRQNSLQDVKRLTMQLKALNPLAVLNRGYSITRNSKGGIIRSVDDVRTGQRVTTRLARGTFESEVKKTE